MVITTVFLTEAVMKASATETHLQEEIQELLHVTAAMETGGPFFPQHIR